MKKDKYTKDEKSLLLYLESRAVDNRGKVDARHMNAEDMTLAKYWNEIEFICFGRIPFHFIDKEHNLTHHVELSEEAWELSAEFRKERSLKNKEYWNWLEE